MNNTVRSACIAFVITVFLAGSASAINREDAIKQAHTTFRNVVVKNQSFQKPLQSRLRSSAVSKLRLDSMVIYSDDSLEFGIDSKIQFEYNSFGQLTYQCMSSMSNDTDSIESMESMVYVYNSNGMMSSDSSFLWDTEKKQWIRGGYNDYVYDIKGKLLQQIEAFVNFSTSFSKTTFSYDETGKQLNQTRYLSEDKNQWSLEDKQDFTYNSNGLLASTTKCSWEIYDNSWLFYAKTEYNYDDKGKDTLTVIYRWNNSTDKWMNDGKVENTYDANGFKTKAVTYELTDGTLSMTKDSKAEYTFDNKGNLLSEEVYSWDEDSLFWTGYIATNYTYDLNIGIEDIIIPFQLNDFAIYNKLTGGVIRFWADLLQDWIPIANVSCYYSSMEVMSLPRAVSTKSSWFFNTKNNVLSLDAANVPASLQLFDLQGRKVASYRNLSITSLSLNHLKSGMYLIELEAKGIKERGKLVVE